MGRMALPSATALRPDRSRRLAMQSFWCATLIAPARPARRSRALAGTCRVWTETVRDALTFASRQTGVDPARLGLLGISLGGGLALATAQKDDRVRALVVDFGFVPTSFNPAGRLPPTLVLHGAGDRVVPVSNAQALRTVLERRGIPHEVQIYPGQEHGFAGKAQADAARRIRAFLDRYLRQTASGAAR